MIHFYKEQIELAVKLIDKKSKYDDIKASNDVNEINTMINTAKSTVEFVNAAKQLDKRINEGYPEIHEIMSDVSTDSSGKQTSIYDVKEKMRFYLQNYKGEIHLNKYTLSYKKDNNNGINIY